MPTLVAPTRADNLSQTVAGFVCNCVYMWYLKGLLAYKDFASYSQIASSSCKTFAIQKSSTTMNASRTSFAQHEQPLRP